MAFNAVWIAVVRVCRIGASDGENAGSMCGQIVGNNRASVATHAIGKLSLPRHIAEYMSLFGAVVLGVASKPRASYAGPAGIGLKVVSILSAGINIARHSSVGTISAVTYGQHAICVLVAIVFGGVELGALSCWRFGLRLFGCGVGSGYCRLIRGCLPATAPGECSNTE